MISLASSALGVFRRSWDIMLRFRFIRINTITVKSIYSCTSVRGRAQRCSSGSAIAIGGGSGLARMVSSATVGGEAGEERGKAALNSVNSAAGLGEEGGQVDQGVRGQPGGTPRRMCGRVTRSAVMVLLIRVLRLDLIDFANLWQKSNSLRPGWRQK